MSPKRKIVLVVAALCAVAIVFFKQPIQRSLLEVLVLRDEAPSQTALGSLLAESEHPLRIVRKLWNSRKVPHRFSAISYIKEHAEVFAEAEPLVIEATQDGDMSVRELALGILASRKHPALIDSALVQLFDADPQIRLLGIQYLKHQPPGKVIPVLMRLIEDPEPQVIAIASVLLQQATGHKVDLKVADALTHNLEESRNKVTEAVRSWKDWWQENQSQYQSSEISASRSTGSKFIVSDFTLPNLDGTRTTLSQFRGKVVLLNFWATWCPSCRQEIPDLVALQDRFPKELVVLGISLDGVKDEHGHALGEHDHEADEDHAHNPGGTHDHKENSVLQRVSKQLRTVVQNEKINYPVLLETENTVGGRFNGGELPTNVLLDQERRLCRRFIGIRSSSALTRMGTEQLQTQIAQQQVK